MKLGGYIGRILRVNLTEREIKTEELDVEKVFNYLGGRGLVASTLYEELEPDVSPLDPQNKLIFMTGPLTGTGFPGAGFVSVGSKSPLTGTISDSSVGGFFGVYLRNGGYDGVIFEGKSEEPVYLIIDDGDAVLKDASDLWGERASEVEKYFQNTYDDLGVVTIGPSGESLSKVSCLVSGGGLAGRGGLGAVMGSKNLKAIVARGSNKVEPVHEEEFEKILRKIRQTVETHPITGTDGSLARFGTSLLVHRVNAAGMIPKDNFSGEEIEFDEVDPLSGETVREKYLSGQVGCFKCPTKCGRLIESRGEEFIGPDYDAVAMLGPNSGFYDYEDEVLVLSNLCAEFGLDPISVGNILGFARAIGEVTDLESAKKLTNQIGFAESVFSEGVAEAAREFGKEEEAVHVKGLELPAYDPRGAKGLALAYATSTRGGDHLQAFTVAPEILSSPEFVDPAKAEGKPELVKKMQDAYAVYDSLIACKFHGFALFTSIDFEMDDIANLLSALTGLDWTNERLHEVGSRIYTIERLFNVREGFDSRDDKLPEKFGLEMGDLLREYYRLRGWNEDGVPEEEVPLQAPEWVDEIEAFEGPLSKVTFPQVQVALDMDADVDTICDIAKRAYDGGSRIIEAGTPAIKRHGVDNLIPPLKEVAPEALIVADLKTMDVGGLEARIAFRSGADVTAVLAIGGKNKIAEAVSEAVQQDKLVLIDFIDCQDPLEKLDELTKEFEGYENRIIFCLHRGISEQLKGRGIYEKEQLLAEARKKAGDFTLAVAGGIKEGVAKNVARAGAEVCIVGSAIYNSSDPKKTTHSILDEVRENYQRE